MLPDKHRCVKQAGDRCDVDSHKHFIIDILKPQRTILHLSVGLIIMQNQLHLQQTCRT